MIVTEPTRRKTMPRSQVGATRPGSTLAQDAQNHESQSQTLDTLPEDILLIVIDLCAEQPRDDPHHPYLTLLGGSLRELSQTNKHIRALCIPRLFRQSMISDTRAEYESENDQVYEKLCQIRLAPSIFTAIRYLRFECWRSKNYHFDLPMVFLQVLNSLSSLEELHLYLGKKAESLLLSMPESYMNFSEAKLEVPSVRAISMASCTDRRSGLGCFLRGFPNLEKLRLTLRDKISFTEVFQYAGELDNLKCLWVVKESANPRHSINDGEGWTFEDVAYIQRMVPNVEYLGMKGQLESVLVSSFAEIIGQFQNLQQLDITDEQVIHVDDLDVIDEGIPHSLDWNEFARAAEEETREKVMVHNMNQDRESVAVQFFKANRSLKRVCLSRPSAFAGQLYEVTRNEDDDSIGAKLVDDEMEPLDGGNVVEWTVGWPKVFRLREIG